MSYKDKEAPVLSIEEALKREGRVSRLKWEEVGDNCFSWLVIVFFEFWFEWGNDFLASDFILLVD